MPREAAGPTVGSPGAWKELCAQRLMLTSAFMLLWVACLLDLPYANTQELACLPWLKCSHAVKELCVGTFLADLKLNV